MDNTSSDINDFHTLHPNRKLAVFSIILFLFVVSVAAGVYVAKNSNMAGKNNVKVEQQSPDEAKATMTVVSDKQSLKVGESATVSVMIADRAVQVADVALTFDPTLLKVSAVTNGDVYDEINYQDLKTPGMILVSSSVNPSSPDELKTGTVLTFQVQALKAGAAELTFNKEKTLAATGGQNFLSTAEGMTITIK